MSPQELKNALRSLGWTQKDLAGKIGVHKNTVSLWAKGQREMPGPAVAYVKLALALRALPVFD